MNSENDSPLDTVGKVRTAFALLRSNIDVALDDGRPEVLDAALRSLRNDGLELIETQYVRLFDE